MAVQGEVRQERLGSVRCTPDMLGMVVQAWFSAVQRCSVTHGSVRFGSAGVAWCC